ncbi:MAG TPA: hypothetical protein VF159_03430 [Gemmatimonadaceae bacterium]
MNADIEQARDDIRVTQQHIGETVAEIESRLSETTSEVARRANPLTYAREYPWIAVGLALGAGLAIALTDADARAASAVASGVKRGGKASVDAANATKEKVVDLLHRDSGEPSDQAEGLAHVPSFDTRADPTGGLADTGIGRAITGLLIEGLDEVLTGLGRQRPSAERRLSGI